MGKEIKTAQKRHKSAGATMVAKAKITFTPAKGFEWVDGEKRGVEWLSNTLPPGEKTPARIRISSRNSDGSYSYFCYRDARAVAVTHSLESAKAACERGPNPKLSDSVIEYVDKHPGEIPPFLLLTDGERRAVRAQYGYAAPSATKVAAVERRGVRTDAGDDSDPGTKRLREQLAREASGSAGKRARAAEGVVAKPKVAKLAGAAGKLVRLDKPGNPKKAGTGAHKRWDALFAACAAASTVAAYETAGGNMETLANAIAKGYVKIEEGK